MRLSTKCISLSYVSVCTSSYLGYHHQCYQRFACDCLALTTVHQSGWFAYVYSIMPSTHYISRPDLPSPHFSCGQGLCLALTITVACVCHCLALHISVALEWHCLAFTISVAIEWHCLALTISVDLVCHCLTVTISVVLVFNLSLSLYLPTRCVMLRCHYISRLCVSLTQIVVARVMHTRVTHIGNPGQSLLMRYMNVKLEMMHQNDTYKEKIGNGTPKRHI